jgi:hypothetical protein
MTCETIIQLVVAIILFFTLLAAVYYARVTNKLWKESVKQTRLMLRPIVVIAYDEAERQFKYVNYGNTPALKIKIDDVSLIDADGLTFDYLFPEEHILPQSERIAIKNIKKKINDNLSETDSFDLGALIPFSAIRTFDIVIRYENAENEKFITEGKLGQDTFDFKRIEKIS